MLVEVVGKVYLIASPRKGGREISHFWLKGSRGVEGQQRQLAARRVAQSGCDAKRIVDAERIADAE